MARVFKTKAFQGLIYSLVLLIISAGSYYGLQNTIATGKAFFFLSEQSSLHWFMSLYAVLTGGQFLVFYTSVFIAKGWLREAIVLTVSGTIVISSMNALTLVKQKPFLYLEPHTILQMNSAPQMV